MSFEERNGLEVDGVAGPVVWEALMKATIAGEVKPEEGAANGFTWVHVSEPLPETVTVWHNGKMVLTEASRPTPASPAPKPSSAPTTSTCAYEETTMSGENPDGSHYSDPGIKWVSYFYGGDALHAFDRASYGSPQSLGCVEMTLRRGRSGLALHADRHPGHGRPLGGTGRPRRPRPQGAVKQVDRAAAGMFVGVALGLDHVPVDDDRAVPVPRRAGQLRRSASPTPAGRPRSRRRSVRRRRGGRRRGSGSSPGCRSARAGGGARRAARRRRSPRSRRRRPVVCLAVVPDRGGGEELGVARAFRASALRRRAAACRPGAWPSRRFEVEHPHDAVLARHQHPVFAEQGGGAGAEVEVVGVQFGLVASACRTGAGAGRGRSARARCRRSSGGRPRSRCRCRRGGACRPARPRRRRARGSPSRSAGSWSGR